MLVDRPRHPLKMVIDSMMPVEIMEIVGRTASTRVSNVMRHDISITIYESRQSRGRKHASISPCTHSPTLDVKLVLTMLFTYCLGTSGTHFV